jgi:hypothetical protein
VSNASVSSALVRERGRYGRIWRGGCCQIVVTDHRAGGSLSPLLGALCDSESRVFERLLLLARSGSGRVTRVDLRQSCGLSTRSIEGRAPRLKTRPRGSRATSRGQSACSKACSGSGRCGGNGSNRRLEQVKRVRRQHETRFPFEAMGAEPHPSCSAPLPFDSLRTHRCSAGPTKSEVPRHRDPSLPKTSPCAETCAGFMRPARARKLCRWRTELARSFVL